MLNYAYCKVHVLLLLCHIFLINIIAANINSITNTYSLEEDSWEFYEHCDQSICATLISKCFLFKKCDCDGISLKDGQTFADSSCYLECENCIGHNYMETCCECLGDKFCHKFPEKINQNQNSKLILLGYKKEPELFNLLFNNAGFARQKRNQINSASANMGSENSENSNILDEGIDSEASMTTPFNAHIDIISIESERESIPYDSDEDLYDTTVEEFFNLEDERFLSSDTRYFYSSPDYERASNFYSNEIGSDPDFDLYSDSTSSFYGNYDLEHKSKSGSAITSRAAE